MKETMFIKIINAGLLVLRLPLTIVKNIIIKYIEPRLIKILSNKIIKLVPNYQNKEKSPRNHMIDMETRKSILPISIAFQEIYNSWPNSDLIGIMNNANKLTKIVYSDYITPVHLWCMNNFRGDFCFWHDGKNLYLIILDQNDKILWKLVWDNQLPKPRDIANLKN